MRFGGFEKIQSRGLVDGWPRVQTARGGSKRSRPGGGPSSARGGMSKPKPKFLVELEGFVAQELAELPPAECLVGSPSRLAVYQQAFLYFINEFTTYRAFLSRIRHEYEGMVAHAQKELRVVPQLNMKLALRESETRRVTQILEVEHAGQREALETKVELLDSQRRKLLKVNRELQSTNDGLQGVVDKRATKQIELVREKEVLQRALSRYDDRDNRHRVEAKVVESLRAQIKDLQSKCDSASLARQQLEQDSSADKAANEALTTELTKLRALHQRQRAEDATMWQAKVDYATGMLEARNGEYETILRLYEEAVQERSALVEDMRLAKEAAEEAQTAEGGGASGETGESGDKTSDDRGDGASSLNPQPPRGPKKMHARPKA
jgi:hypothetical protein